MPERSEAAALLPASESLGYRPLQEILRDRLRRAILDADYQPGARLNIYTIARHFGVSPVPVREALRSLEADGLLEFTPNRGAAVRTLSVEELREAFFIRIALITAALRTAVPRLTDDDLNALQTLVLNADRAVDVEEARQLNFAFHARLQDAAEMPRVFEAMDRMTALAGVYQKLNPDGAGLARVQADHAAILAACRRRDGTQAAKLMERHLAATRDALIATLDGAASGGGSSGKRRKRVPKPIR